MTHAFCSECGCGVYQRPKDVGFHAIFPETFRIERPVPAGDEEYPCGVSTLLPADMLPIAYINDENRLMDWQGDLPKFRTFPHREVKLANDGKVVTA